MKKTKREENIMQRKASHIRVENLYCPVCQCETEQGISIQITWKGEERECADCLTCDNTGTVREKKAAQNV